MSSIIWQEASPFLKIIPCTGFNNWLFTNCSFVSFNSLNIPHGTYFIYILWNIWIMRNREIFQCAPFYAPLAISNANNQAMEWFFLGELNLAPSPIASRMICWTPPKGNWIKYNSDGTCFNNKNRIGDIAAGVFLEMYMEIGSRDLLVFLVLVQVSYPNFGLFTLELI